MGSDNGGKRSGVGGRCCGRRCGAVVAVLLFLGALGAYHELTSPLYVPGHLSEMPDSFFEPLGGNETHWEVERGVFLYRVASQPPAEGRRAVLVVHGGPGAPTGVWEAAAHHPLSEFSLHYYDQRGCGRSTRPFDAFPGEGVMDGLRALDAGLGIGVQVADMERARRAMGEERLLLVGHSYGAFLAALYAAEFPGRVERLVLVSPAPLVEFPPADGGIFGAVRARLRDEDEGRRFDEWMARYLDFGALAGETEASMARMQAEFARFYAGAVGRDPEQLPSATRRRRHSGGGDGDGPGGWMPHAQYASMGWRHDYSDALEAVDAPALVVHGGRDLQSVADSRLYVDYLRRGSCPSVSMRVIDDATHFAYDERPDEFARLVGDFLA